MDKSTQSRFGQSPLTVGDIVRRILPYGTRPGQNSSTRRYATCPIWAADVFAVAAAIVHASSCYAEPGVALSRNDNERRQKLERAKLHIEMGKQWAQSGAPSKIVRDHWQTLFLSFDLPVYDSSHRALAWKKAALALTALSDEAFSGAGYFPAGDDGFANYVWYELVNEGDPDNVLELPHSMALMVPSEIACVLPKALAPNVGCTLRSLSHNVAFLPGKGIVKPEWRVNPGDEISSRLVRARRKGKSSEPADAPDGVFNMLVVPFPYVVHATDFRVSRPARGDADGYFAISQGWLKNGRRNISATVVAKFIGDLIEKAEREAGPIHAVILPEGALNERLGSQTASLLARRFRKLELFVSGELIDSGASQRNVAAHYRFVDGQLATSFKQSKHHRWRLEKNQIRQYQLGGILDPNRIWWEHIDVHDRTIGFAINRHGAIIAALVCEDLARQDPVLPTVAAVGPTLMIALLLDGPQMPNRWPGRYATVLAEDPGSSVLTLTSLGMIQRSVMPGNSSKSVVGLWKDVHEPAKELILPSGYHGIVLSLNCCDRHQVTLDHRVSSRAITEYRLGAARAVRLDDAPKWLDRNS